MKTTIRHGYSSQWLTQMIDLYNKTELKRSNPEVVDRAFQKSFAVVSCWIDTRLVAIGRMISDGEMYSGIFDVVVDPEFQKAGLGKTLMHELIARAPQTCIHLTSTFGNEMFYYKLGFKRHKTALSLYPPNANRSPYLDHDWKPM